jgi:glycosyltransferase involved in cell wall biosynthesis
MTRISALTPGVNVPSSKYRVRQYIPLLNDAGISVDEFAAKIDYSAKLPGILGRVRQRYIFPVSATWIGIKSISRINDIIKSNRYDAVWLNRIVVNTVYMEKFIRRPLIYDVDDAIWLNDERITRKIAQKAEIILAGNSFIADWFCKVNPNINIIPTAIDTQWFCPSDSKPGNLFKIVWTGSQQTIHYLLSIEKALAKFLNERKDVLLIVISDVCPKFTSIRKEKIRFIKWTPEDEVVAIQEARVGIMPLNDTPWERGKCSFKMLKYMACRIPVLVSPVGMNNEVLSKGEIGFAAFKDDDWVSGLEFFYKNRDKSKLMGFNGTQVINKYYSLDIVTKSLVQIFRNI